MLFKLKHNLIFVCLLFCILATCNCVFVKITKPTKNDYSVIDNFFHQQPVEERETLLEASRAEDYMHSAILQLIRPSKNGLLANESSRVGKALKQFTAMHQMKLGNCCNKKMIAIVEANLACMASKHRFIDQVIEYYKYLHADLCRSVFIEKFRVRMSEMSPEQFYEIENILEDLLQNFIQVNKSPKDPFPLPHMRLVQIFSNLNNNHNDLHQVGSQAHTRLLLSRMFPAIKENKKDLKKNDKITHCRVRTWFKRHVISPCKYYVKKLGADIFDLAERTGAIRPKFGFESNRQQIAFLDDELIDVYYGSWTRYKVCQALLAYGSKQMAQDTFDLKIFVAPE